MKTKIETLPIGLYEENCYLIHENGHVLIVDPGRFAEEIERHIQKEEVVDGIVLTHGHSDHTMATDDLVDVYQCPIYMNSQDRLLVSKDAGRVDGTESPVYHPIEELNASTTTIGTFPVRVYETPGHTKGSICIAVKNSLFTGDTLFAGTCGRTDLYSGNESEMRQSLAFLGTLPKDLRVYPGHGPASTIGQECKVNPFLLP